MTIGTTKEIVQNAFDVNDEQQTDYKMVFKEQRAHERALVGVEFVRERQKGQLSLISIAHDSLKFWSVITFVDEIELAHLKEVKRWNCGVQSYALVEHEKGRELLVVGTESVLHIVGLPAFQRDGATRKVQRGLMEIWFVQGTPTPGHFLTVNFQANQLQILNTRGELTHAVPFEKAKQISAIVYGTQFVAIGNSHGVISLLTSPALQFLYSIEAHSMKVRCLTFLTDHGKLLSGSDDKTIKLFALGETRAQLLRIFCGHKGIVTGLAVCEASESERFASCGTDNCAIVWDTESGEQRHVFSECTGMTNDVPRCVAFTPNGRFLVAGSEEASILAFRVPHPKNYVEQLPSWTEEQQRESVGEANSEGMADEWAEERMSPFAEFDSPHANSKENRQKGRMGATSSGGETPNDAAEFGDDNGRDDNRQTEEAAMDVEEMERRELEMQLGID
ncbi:hypothetical protein niasHT_010340 [Heterodera trifolii]|uniref:Uncharacterized protein n=1 Tax=Heterodera trifolii TaxID=157864 RepID=A0ABD2M6L6_9BILA